MSGFLPNEHGYHYQMIDNWRSDSEE
jgi:hypothetical protein